MSDRITLQLEGLMLEKLLNRALDEGACFHSIVHQSRRRMLIVSDTASAATLLALAEKYHLDCRIVRQKGLRSTLARMRRHATLPVALLICALCMVLFLSRVWIIDVQHTGTRPAQNKTTLQNALSALGIRPGTAKNSIDPDQLSLELGAQAENLSFIGVRLQGVRLLVEAAPEIESPELFEVDRARDLVAACDGVIISVNAKSGKACVEPGDTVRKGQILIRGEERISGEETRGVSALGEVLARTWFSAEADAPLTERVHRYTGRESRSSVLRLRNYRIPLDEEESFALCETKTELLPVGGMFLPLVIERTTKREYEETFVSADENALKTALETEALTLAAEKMQAETGGVCQIIDKWVDYSMIDASRLRVRAVLEVQRNIAATRDSLYQGGN